MIIIKFDETLLNLSAKEMYSGPILDVVIMDKLRAKFEGRCEKNVLILKILEMTKRSGCIMSQNTLEGAGSVNIQFKAEAMVYNKGDILVGCEILKIERGGKIICIHEMAIVTIEGNRALQSLKPGQKISVIVDNSSYPYGKNKIMIYGIPYVYSFRFEIYKLSAVVQNENLELISKKLHQIEEEIKLQTNKKRLNYFNEVYYPFKISWEQYKKKADLGKVDIIDLIKFSKDVITGKFNENMAVFRHPLIDKSTTDLFAVKEADLHNLKSDLINTDTYGVTIVSEDASIVVLKLLNEYLNHMRAMNELAILFNVDKDLESHNNVWNIYQKIKK